MTPTPQPNTSSPFPGMDPYIEAQGWWEDFHAKFIAEIERRLTELVPKRYYVDIAERAYIVLVGPDGKEDRVIIPDVSVSGLPIDRGGTAVRNQHDVETEAVTLRPFIDTPFRETFIEIREAEDNENLVTCIEVLSPSNKRKGSEGWELYLRKRNALMLGSANLVELDLLRGGRRMPMLDPWPSSPYYALVCRQSRAPSCRVWPASFRRPLPTVPIPLSGDDADVLLDLQPLVDAVYTRSRLAERLDYTKVLAPPLNADDGTWLQEQLRLREKQATPEHTTS